MRAGGQIAADAQWSGEVMIAEDVVVADGAILRIAAGSSIFFPEGSGGKPLTRWGRGAHVRLGSPVSRHLKILGTVEILGADDAPVRVEGPGFGGILLIGRARLIARGVHFSSSAGFAVQCADLAEASLNRCRFAGGPGALFCCGFSRAVLRRCRVDGSAEACIRVCDDARLRAADCQLQSGSFALTAEALAHVVLRGCRLAGDRRSAEIAGAARVRSDGEDLR